MWAVLGLPVFDNPTTKYRATTKYFRTLASREGIDSLLYLDRCSLPVNIVLVCLAFGSNGLSQLVLNLSYVMVRMC